VYQTATARMMPLPRLGSWGQPRRLGEAPLELAPWDAGFSPMHPPRLGRLGQDTPDVVPWDPHGTASQGRADVWNAGCPDGYFAQFVGVGEPGATPAPGKTGEFVRCRLLATTTQQTVQDESGITSEEAVQVYTRAVADTAQQVKTTVQTALSWSPFILGGAAILVGGIVLMRILR
jgi:hypothetical protein